MHTLTSILVILFVGTVKSWDYWDYKNAKEIWPSIPQASCHGSSQSPINIDEKLVTRQKNVSPSMNRISINYGPVPGLSIENNGKTLIVQGAMGSMVSNGKIYTAKQFHFHQPAEHKISGRHADMEMHVVHFNEITSDLVILAFLFRVEADAPDNKFLAGIGYNSPSLAKKGSSALIAEINLMDLFTGFDMEKMGVWDSLVDFFTGPGFGNVAAWDYSGSLTTPPCTEGQRFLVFQQQRVMSRRQWDGFARSVGHGIDWEKKTGNSREVQPLNGRKVYRKVFPLKIKE
jgi:carbonic anhydrase